MSSTVEIVSSTEDGSYEGMTTFTFVLARGGVMVQAEGVLYLDYEDEDELEGIFEEWLDMAEQGVDGYTVLEA